MSASGLPEHHGPFRYAKGELRVGRLPLAQLAERFGTPLYVYDFDAIRCRLDEYRNALGEIPSLICAAVKANANLSLLRHLAAAGSGFDVVSGGELERVLQADGTPERVVFSGVGKTAEEMDLALRAGILLFQVESEPELELLAARAARLRRTARFGLRVNPDVPAGAHPHIATGLRTHKFGVSPQIAARLLARSACRWLEPAGLSFHIGSQILDPAPFGQAARRLAQLLLRVEQAQPGLHLRYVDVGGGLGIAYRGGDHAPALSAYAAALLAGLRPALRRRRQLILEPGRGLLGAAGILLTRVLYVKENGGRRFAIMDAGANDLLRPSLYDAYHEILPLRPQPGRRTRFEVVGPLCESGDVLGRDRLLPPLAAGDYLAIMDTGAYGFVLSSNYNARPRAAEIAHEKGHARLIRRRESRADLWALEI